MEKMKVRKRSRIVSVKFDDETLNIIDRLVYENRTNRSEVVRYIVKEWLEETGLLCKESEEGNPK